MAIVYRIQHRPGRESINRLLALLPPAVEVIADGGSPPSPWRGYQLCLSGIPESGHLLVLQDDALVCCNFAAALEQIAAANPNTVVSLFTSRGQRRTYNMCSLRYGKSRYVTIHPQDLVHVVGTLWPVDKAREFMEWIEANPRRLRGGELTTSDDACLTRWMKLTGQTIRCTVPSIVQHLDDVPSIVNQLKVKDGKDSSRTAAYWIGGDDPLELNWSR